MAFDELTGMSPDVVSVLVVDDVAMIRTLLSTVLESSGHFAVVGEAGDGESAVIAAGALRPDLILLDLSMPGMDGLEALPLIRAAAPETTVVVNSGIAADRAAHTALELGAKAYLEKGLTPDEIVQRLVELAGGRTSPIRRPPAPIAAFVPRVPVPGPLRTVDGDAVAWWTRVLAHLTDGVVVLDADGVVITCNQAAIQMLETGVSPGARFADLGWELVDDVGALVDVTSWLSAATPGGEYTAIGQLFRRGRVLEAAVCGIDGHGQALGVPSAALALLLTDSSDARARTEAEGFNTALASLLHDGVLCLDEHGAICAWNDAAGSSFGWSRREIEGRPVASLFAPGSAAAIDEAIAQARAGQAVVDCAAVAIARDGSPFEVALAAASTGPAGNHVCVVVEDASNRLHAFRTLRRAEGFVECLHAVVRGIVQPDPDPLVLEHALETLAQGIDAGLAQLWLVDDGALVCRGPWAMRRNLHDIRTASERSSLAPGVHGPGRAWAEARPIATTLDAGRGVGVSYAAPLIHGGRTIGVLEAIVEGSHTADEPGLEIVGTTAMLLAPRAANLAGASVREP